MPNTVLCIASFVKGQDFIRACKRQGGRILLLTAKYLENGDWPHEAIDEMLYVDESDYQWNQRHLTDGLNYLFGREPIDRIVALEDMDITKAGLLRDHFRLPGLSYSQSLLFKDKLAMRDQAIRLSIRNPEYVGAFDRKSVEHFVQNIPGPWILKPRQEAASMGISKFEDAKALLETIEKLEGQSGYYIVERFIEGEVYHVDSLSVNGKVVFARTHQYLSTPFSAAQDGKVAGSFSLPYESEENERLTLLTKQLLTGFGMMNGVNHTEFLRGKADGEFYFLETASRVGGAYTANMVEASSGLNLWEAWGELEALPSSEDYRLPAIRQEHSGIVLSLAKQERPDTSAYEDPEIVWRLEKPYHVGLIARSQSQPRVAELLAGYAQRFYEDFHAAAPLPSSASEVGRTGSPQ